MAERAPPNVSPAKPRTATTLMVSPHGCVSGIPRKSHQRLLNICNGKRSFRSVDELCRAGAGAGSKQCPWAVTKWKHPRWPHQGAHTAPGKHDVTSSFIAQPEKVKEKFGNSTLAGSWQGLHASQCPSDSWSLFFPLRLCHSVPLTAAL